MSFDQPNFVHYQRKVSMRTLVTDMIITALHQRPCPAHEADDDGSEIEAEMAKSKTDLCSHDSSASKEEATTAGSTFPDDAFTE